MPFLDDIGPRDDPRGTVWATFATIGEQVERLVVVNLAWALQLVPGLAALAFPELPLWARAALGLYSATAVPPATAVLHGLAAEAGRRQHIDVDLARQYLRTHGARSLRTLAPLYGIGGVLAWLAAAAAGYRADAALTLVTFALLVWSVVSVQWGPLFAADPDQPMLQLARQGIRLTLRRPEATLGTWALSGLFLLVGLVSIGGLCLVVPILIAVLQTHRQVDS